MNITPHGNLRRVGLIFFVSLIYMFAISFSVTADVNYKFDYQDPAGDVLEFNETWNELGTVDTQPQIDFKWLRSANDTMGNVVLRLEFKNHQTIEISNETKYVFSISTSQDNSTGYNITYRNSSAIISNFNNTLEENMTSNISIIYDKGEVLTVKISKNKYLDNITHFNVDAYTWKELNNRTYIDYISEVPGHPGATGTVVDGGDGGDKEEEGLLDMLCANWLLLLILLFIIIVIITVIVLKR